MIAAFKLNLPVILGVLSGVIPYMISLFIQAKMTTESMFVFTKTHLFFFVLGLFYTHFFEWWFHHGPMHHRMRFFPEAVKLSHLEHHRVFHGDNYRSDNPEDLKYITGAYYRWPISFLFSYLLFIFLFPMKYAAIFFLGVVLHFMSYELTHWFSHREADNLFDRIISHIPVINKIRERQIEHHGIHHEEPRWDFAFNPPYFWDYVFRTKK